MKKNLIFGVLLVISIVILFTGVIFMASTGIPIQDSEYAPASVLARSGIDMIVGRVLFLSGILLFLSSIIWRIFLNRNK